MWSVKETENELVIKSYPLVIWGMVFLCFVLGFFVANVFFGSFGLSGVRNLFEGDVKDVLLRFLSMAFFPLGGLLLFHFEPMVVTHFDGRERILSYKTYTLFGKRTRKIGFDALKGGVRVKSEESEGTTLHSLYIELASGEKLNLSNELSWFEKRVFNIAQKANEFLQTQNRRA